MDLKKCTSSLVIWDSCGTFYWRDRMAESYGGVSVTLQSSIHRSVGKLVSQCPVIMVSAKPCLFPPKRRDSATPEYREYLPPAWQKLVGHRVVMDRMEGAGSGQYVAIPLKNATASNRRYGCMAGYI